MLILTKSTLHEINSPREGLGQPCPQAWVRGQVFALKKPQTRNGLFSTCCIQAQVYSPTHPSVNLVTLPWAIYPAEYILNLQNIALNSCIASPYTILASIPDPTQLSIACSMAHGKSLGTRQASSVSSVEIHQGIVDLMVTVCCCCCCFCQQRLINVSFGQTTENDLMWMQHVIHDVTMQDYTTPDK